eukprot:2619661-Prymnesium_polylepis.1
MTADHCFTPSPMKSHAVRDCDARVAPTHEHAASATREQKDVGLHAAIAAFGRDKFTVRLVRASASVLR